METVNFLTWASAIALIAGFALGVMRWAYVGSGSIAVAFQEPIHLTFKPDDPLKRLFQEGIQAFQQGQYRKAVDRFTAVLKASETCPEAHHNRGLAQANLRQDNEAVRSLVRAGELYLEQGNADGYHRVKEHLESLKQARSKTA